MSNKELKYGQSIVMIEGDIKKEIIYVGKNSNGGRNYYGIALEKGDDGKIFAHFFDKNKYKKENDIITVESSKHLRTRELSGLEKNLARAIIKSLKNSK